ncbi:AfsR/SARP family transcriptional regulator [Streptomyces sp. SLBN-115]|uniref:AfsR/SARP family transcriptional regulator n=1 Tax=Streptomyces sp. SLBN-115 TaxID=2768453 RepID=UPI00116CB988|nr:BTAD domain-containing putative transcriptional regulator [Streptomyces sp. SLBN-115]TQJ47401.1 DNA-binding SARP family transcriptional activator [Streptomyces sp. SLBN-115]
MRFEVLGPVRVWREERELDPGFPQQRALLALLLAHAGRSVPTTEIVDVLWAERPPASALNVVRRYVGALRRLLEPGLPPRAPGRRLLRRTGGYLLEAATDEVDLLRFRELTRQGKRAAATGRAETAARQFVLALGEWRGQVAMGIPASAREHVQFTAVQRELLETARLAADAALLCGQAEQALPALRRATAHDPLDESLHARLVLVLAACGLQAEALGAYEDVRRRLARDLGLIPGTELAAAHTRVLRQDVGHRLKSGPVVHLGRPIHTTKTTTTPAPAPTTPAPTAPPPPGPPTPGPVVPAPATDGNRADAAGAAAPGLVDAGDGAAGAAVLGLSASHLSDCGAPASADADSGRTARGPGTPRPVGPGPARVGSTGSRAVAHGLAAVAEVGGPGRTTDAPAGRGRGVGEFVRPARLPSAVPSFVGRVVESEWLERAAGSAAGVVLVGGLAGIGKSTLALHWAHRTIDRFPDGQLYVALRGSDTARPAVESADALRGMLAALGVPASRMPDGLDALTGMYRTLLARRRVLVVLDDAAGTGQLSPLLPTGPGCLALVTSRHALPGLVASGARPLRLATPPAEEAHALLAGRLGAERVAAEPRAADEIVARCGRLPLALATVAARAADRRDFPLAAVAGELREAHGSLDALAATREAFQGSYRLLAPDSARLLRLLPRHEGPDITPAGVAALAGLPVRRARLLLGVLADAHLLTEPAPGRYTLHDLVRVFATERAAAEGRPRGR